MSRNPLEFIKQVGGSTNKLGSRFQQQIAAQTTRQLHSTAKSQAVKTVAGKLPPRLIEKHQEEHHKASAVQEARDLIIPRQELEKRSAEFFKFLKSDPSPEAKSMLEIIEQFNRRGSLGAKKPVVILEGIMPAVSHKQSKVFTHEKNISTDSFGITPQQLMDELRKQELNINMVQILYNLCGYNFFTELNDINPATFTLVRSQDSQSPHMDDDVDEKGKPLLGANALWATKSQNPKPPFTKFTHIFDIVKNLSPKTLAILQKPLFAKFGSEKTGYSENPHPILKKRADGTFALLYPSPVEIIEEEKAFAVEGVNFEETQKALAEFQRAVIEAEKNQGLSVNLSASQKGQPDNMVIFENAREDGGSLMHRRVSQYGIRESANPVIIEGSNAAERTVISVAAARYDLSLDSLLQAKKPNQKVIIDKTTVLNPAKTDGKTI